MKWSLFSVQVGPRLSSVFSPGFGVNEELRTVIKEQLSGFSYYWEFTANCEAPLNLKPWLIQKKVWWDLQFRGRILHQVETFRYLRVLFTSNGWSRTCIDGSYPYQ